MEVYEDLLDSIQDVGFPTSAKAKDLQQWVKQGASSETEGFVPLCNFCISELLGESAVSAASLYTTLPKLLQKLECKVPADNLAKDEDARLLVLEFLVAEVQASRILESKIIAQKVEVSATAGNNQAVQDAITNASIHNICLSLQLDLQKSRKVNDVLTQAIPKVTALVQRHPALSRPVLAESELTPQQKTLLSAINQVMQKEYSQRRQLMLSRFKVTMQAFEWSEKKGINVDEIKKIKDSITNGFNSTPIVRVSDVFSTSPAVLWNVQSKVSGEDKKLLFKGAVHKTIKIGFVPDRGGRTNTQSFESRVEADVARSNMELQQKYGRSAMQQAQSSSSYGSQQQQQGGGGHYGGRGGGGRGGGGGYNQQQQQQSNQQQQQQPAYAQQYAQQPYPQQQQQPQGYGGGGRGGGGHYQQQQPQQQQPYQQDYQQQQYNRGGGRGGGSGGGGAVQGGWAPRGRGGGRY